MHHYLMEQLASDHRRELRRRAATSHRQAPAKRGKPVRSARRRAGWILVEVGLRLTSTPGDA